VLDALPALRSARELGVPFATIARALAGFRGVRRRFEISRAHAAHDARRRLRAPSDRGRRDARRGAREFLGPLVVAFQPHRYTRTRYLAADFARALRGADLVDAVRPSTPRRKRRSPASMRALIGGPLAAAGTRVEYVADVADLPAYAARQRAPQGALVLCSAPARSRTPRRAGARTRGERRASVRRARA
jgi:UDP-N-acetylmuramate--alanine ligase